MVTIEAFSRLVSGVYAAALTPQLWGPAVRDIHREMGGTVGTLGMAPDGTSSIIGDTTLPADALASYAQHYGRLDHVLTNVMKGPVGAVRTGSELVAPRRHSEFYSCWLRPNDMGDGLMVRLTGPPENYFFIVGAPPRTEFFDTPDRVKLMSGLIAHLQQALRTQDAVAPLPAGDGEPAGVLDVIRHGVILVGGDHLVINLNAAAERICRAGDGLCMRSGRFAAMNTAAEQELHGAIRNALTDGGSRVRRGRSLSCRRPSGVRPYVIHVLPYPRRDTDVHLGGQMAVVLIIDPENEPEPATELLQRLYHLTRSEAEIALQVMRGVDLKQTSEELSLSLSTVRTHLQHVFDKTDTHRQAELVRVLIALCP
ncbi:helix-turn-helix transcriptional regulator [Rhodococcus daqingensis]|uniref:Helix-turn-helix transcriptional regulator n=1 Tax=Rhodococcus daqingensis TaxID=2479363 RepID=A0ABW2RZ63_9NOCA